MTYLLFLCFFEERRVNSIMKNHTACKKSLRPTNIKQSGSSGGANQKIC